MQQFKQTFFDESAEFLGVAETGLLRLTPGNADMEEINAIFRAVHSIKGGGGAFGFSDLVKFAHEFETVMDGVRTSAVHITDDVVDTLIRANDILGRLLAHARDGTRPAAGETDQVVTALKLISSTIVDEVDIISYTPKVAIGKIDTPTQVSKSFTVSFQPKPDLLLTGNDPYFMMRALKHLGVAEVACDTDKLPDLTHLEPELIYLHWRVSLITTGNKADIDDIFEFV
ncbi:MAG: Hpt domain-containing protein, partial [Rhodospirillaceae bacterium]